MERWHMGSPRLLGYKQHCLGHKRNSQPSLYGRAAACWTMGTPECARCTGRFGRQTAHWYGLRPVQWSRHLGSRWQSDRTYPNQHADEYTNQYRNKNSDIYTNLHQYANPDLYT